MTTKTTSYHISQQPPPEEYAYTYDQLLYHQEAFQRAQQQRPAYTFFLYHHDRSECMGTINFHTQDNLAVSQAYAPFGSFNGQNITYGTAFQVVDVFKERLFHDGIKKITMHHPPGFYQAGPWDQVLMDSGFEVGRSINHHLVVDDQALDQKMHQMEVRKLARCRHFEFSLYPSGALKQVYSFISGCRRQRMQNLSMSFARLNKVVTALPNHFLLCVVKSKGQWAAASIVLKVNSSCWYQFYPAHSKEFNRESPLVYLISELYLHAREQNVHILDLGSSELNGTPIHGLLTFKDRIGGVRSLRSTYELSF